MKITKEQKQEKLNAIVESAISVFVALGYEKTTFKDIADKMGIARSTIYLYFKDNLKTGTYKLVFSLYDGNVYVGDIYKYIIIK